MSTSRRQAKYFVSMFELSRMLQLPDGVRAVFMYPAADPPGLYLIVESDAFPEQLDDCELPVITSNNIVETVEIAGVTYARSLRVPGTVEDLAGQIRQRSSHLPLTS